MTKIKLLNKRELSAEKRELNRKKGLCSCGKTLSKNFKTCEWCRKKNKKVFSSMRKKGLCLCGRVPDVGKKVCELCLYKKRRTTIKYTTNGFCRCGRETKYSWSKTCIVCLEKAKKYRRKKSKLLKQLYRKPTKEEIEKYGGRSQKSILKSYHNLFY